MKKIALLSIFLSLSAFAPRADAGTLRESSWNKAWMFAGTAMFGAGCLMSGPVGWGLLLTGALAGGSAAVDEIHEQFFAEKPVKSDFFDKADRAYDKKMREDTEYNERYYRRKEKEWQDYWTKDYLKEREQENKKSSFDGIFIKKANAGELGQGERKINKSRRPKNAKSHKAKRSNKPQGDFSRRTMDDNDSERELSPDEIPDPDNDDYVWCEDVCGDEGLRPVCPSDTAHCIYWGCSRCGHVIRRKARVAKRKEKEWKAQGKDCWWHGTQFDIRQAKSVDE